MDCENDMMLENEYGAHNYAPLPVVLARGKGAFVWGVDGKRYIDMMSAYSAVSLGHCHPAIVEVIKSQSESLGVVSRAYYNNRLGFFLKTACELTGFPKALPMNGGVEAVETALKAARKWGYAVKGIPENQAEIIVCSGNFHGRTISVISFSSEEQYRKGFGPFTPGFRMIPYNDAEALAAAITPNTAAFLVEPIQGEAGIIVPDPGYLARCQEICRLNNVLMICDEIQTGLGRTGALLACHHDHVQPDAVILGKALGGGFVPLSLFLARADLMEVFTPGDHGSTFGGNPFSAAIGSVALEILTREGLVERSRVEGEYFLKELKKIKHPAIKAVRGKGLFIGIELDPALLSAREMSLALLAQGLLTKETHHTVIRFAPPLVISREELTEAIEIIKRVFHYNAHQ